MYVFNWKDQTDQPHQDSDFCTNPQPKFLKNGIFDFIIF